MKILLDTHIFLWYLIADSRLPKICSVAIQDPKNEIYLSVASIWEAVIKQNLGKLSFPSPPAAYLPQLREAHGIASLPVEEGAMVYLETLPSLHRDPFDRMIVAQALQYSLTIATVDHDIVAYPVQVLTGS